ncbi:hypothetical protein ADICYQ_2978 [Cyclobacterium qasimii M12-11B]|uniref:Uncharacterized protein n=1 Tax=Cyclobacterium qasimii M12-11B TaxID=641524 RepID=S7VD46_9BACT|nr:hypothetical protein ADICYQ_2978 [Cyclobacterium qasimii M12-11B]
MFKVSIRLGKVSDGVVTGNCWAYVPDKDIMNTKKNTPEWEM